MKLSRIVWGAVVLGALCGCQRSVSEGFLGSAIVASRTYQVAGVIGGQIEEVYKQEGQAVAAGELCAVIDTTLLVLQLQEAEAARGEMNQNIAARQSELGSMKSDIRGLAREYGRIGDLADKGSLPTQQKDDLATKVQSADLRLKASQKMYAGLSDKLRGMDARIDQLREQISRCYLHSPAAGIVTTRFKNPGEVVGVAMPVLEIGRYDTLWVDFFVPQPVLASVKIDQPVRIRVDLAREADKSQETFIPATITWIGSEAEFSPKNIQTRESRHELVFKIRATAANPEGILKAGLPVEVWRDVELRHEN
jgi:HlyD family secretion protein